MSDGNLFLNPFRIDDLAVFDDEAWFHLLSHNISLEALASAIRAASTSVIERIARNLPISCRNRFWQAFAHSTTAEEVMDAQRQVLDRLFWELIYWCMPDEYEMLTAGEYLHPGIFQQLASDLRGKTVLDAGAGSGRATIQCLEAGAERVFAIEPSPGLRRILRQKFRYQIAGQRVVVTHGRFDALPLSDQSVDLALSCSAFTALPEQGGESGLRELFRVTRPGGKIVVIWPRVEDRAWLQERGFQYVNLPLQQEMALHFHTLGDALHCARLFYGRRPSVHEHILATQKPEIPFSLIDINPPCDYYWCEVSCQSPFSTQQSLKTVVG
jgi:SAM-dependent methyltransferase